MESVVALMMDDAGEVLTLQRAAYVGTYRTSMPDGRALAHRAKEMAAATSESVS